MRILGIETSTPVVLLLQRTPGIGRVFSNHQAGAYGAPAPID